MVRSDLAELRNTLAEVKAATDQIPAIGARLDRLEAAAPQPGGP